MIPVISIDNKPLMPCTSARARLLMKSGDAKPWYQKNIFCIKMLREASDNKYQEVVLGIDPGSKREGYTVTTETKVVINITTNTKDGIKDKLENRKALRNNRRQRKTPYRKCRYNRSVRLGWIPPSTKSRWDTKINMIKYLSKILPITTVVIEDIKATTIKGNDRRNKSFSPLEIGKNYFYNEIIKMSIVLHKVQGYNTAKHRNLRGFKKSKKKLEYVWEAHNVDSHCLCEIALCKDIGQVKSLYKIEYFQFYRRQLHVQLLIKGGKRRKYGGTVSMGMSRGSYLYYTGKQKHNKKLIPKDKLYYLGGSSKGNVTMHDIETGGEISKYIDKRDIKIMYRNNKRISFIN